MTGACFFAGGAVFFCAGADLSWVPPDAPFFSSSVLLRCARTDDPIDLWA